MRSKHINSIIKEAIYSESGRSLVEMLGVLAIMGILTIGGIVGFNYAMNKQRANATVNYVNQLAIEGSRQMMAGSNHLSLLDYPDKTPSGYGVELRLLKDTNAYFEVYVKDVPEAVCNQIQTMSEGWRGLDTLWINEDGRDCNKETNTMSFIFTDSLSRGTSGTRCTSDEGCSGCQTCQRGFCTDNNDSCPADTPHCVSGSCEKCPAGEFQDSRGKCYKCNESQTLWVADKAECDKCLGTRLFTSRGDDGAGNCALPCPKGQFIGENGRCFPCDEPLYKYSRSEYCAPLCPNREYIRNAICSIPLGQCAEGYVLQDDYDHKCVKCDDTIAITNNRVVGRNCLSACGTWREIKTFTGTNGESLTACALKECPADAPIRKTDGGCVPCGHAAYVISADECSKCSNLRAVVDTMGRTYCQVK